MFVAPLCFLKPISVFKTSCCHWPFFQERPAFEVIDKWRNAVGNEWVVLNISVADIQFGGARFVSVESQIIKVHERAFYSLRLWTSSKIVFVPVCPSLRIAWRLMSRACTIRARRMLRTATWRSGGPLGLFKYDSYERFVDGRHFTDMTDQIKL
jgi:hypothetical protein